MNIWKAHENSIMRNLSEFAMADFNINEAQFFNRYARGETSRCRQVFVLVTTDNGFAKGKVADFMKMDPSYITQVRRRHYPLRLTAEYIHLKGVLSTLTGGGVLEAQ